MQRIIDRFVSRVWIAGACATLALVALAVLVTPSPAVAAGPSSLPLTDFLEAQGVNSWDPEEPGMFAWTGRPPTYPRAGYMDYAGACDRWLLANGHDGLGTKITGTFTRKALGGGMYEFSVNVQVKSTLAWCKDISDGDWGKPVVFGCHLPDLVDGATPALGDCTFKATWRQAGTIVPDLSFAANYCGEWEETSPGVWECTGGWPLRPDGWALLDIDMQGSATGPLHASAGLGAEGTPGRLHIAQRGANQHQIGHGQANQDGMPAEVMDLKAVGN